MILLHQNQAIARPFLMEGPDEARCASRNFQRVACENNNTICPV